MWLVIITMTTVGHGDYYPKSDLGKLVAVGAALCGLLLFSLTLVAMKNWLTLSDVEVRSLSLM